MASRNSSTKQVKNNSYVSELINKLDTNLDKESQESTKANRKATVERNLDTSYKMTKEQKKTAKQTTKNYYANNKKANDIRRASSSNPNIARKMYESMTPEEQKEYDDMNALWNKTSGIASFTGGALEALPGYKQLAKKYDEVFQPNRGIQESLQNVKKQNLAANIGGNIASNIGQYAIAGELLGGISGFDKAGKAITSAVPGLENATGKALANLLRGQTADTLVDTLPNIFNDISEGKSGGEVALNALKNQGTNLAFNVLGEGLGNTFDAIKSLKNEGKNGVKAAEDTFDYLNILDDTDLNLSDAEAAIRSNPNFMYRSLPTNTDDTAKLAKQYAEAQNEIKGYTSIPALRDDTEALAKQYAGYQATGNKKAEPMMAFGSDIDAKKANQINRALDEGGEPLEETIKRNSDRINSLRAEQNVLKTQAQTEDVAKRYKEIEDEIYSIEYENLLLSNPDVLAQGRYTSIPTSSASQIPSLNDSGAESIRTPLGSITISPELLGRNADDAVDAVKTEIPTLETVKNTSNQVEPKTVKLEQQRSELQKQMVELQKKIANNQGNVPAERRAVAQLQNQIDDVTEQIDNVTTTTQKASNVSKKKVGEYDPELDFVDEEQNLAKEVLGENQKPIVESPKDTSNSIVTTDSTDRAISQHYETLKNSDMFKSAEAQAKLEAMKNKGVFDKVGGVEKRKKSMDKAAYEFAENPDKVIDDVLKNDEWTSGLDVDKSALCINNALETGDTALLNRLSRVENIKLSQSGRILRAVQDNYVSTAGGTVSQGTKYMLSQADSLLKKGGKVAEECVTMAENAVNTKSTAELLTNGMDIVNAKAIQDAIYLGADTEEISKMIAMYKKLGTVQISDDTINQIKSIYNQIEKSGFGINSKERAKLEAQAYSLLANEIGGKRSLKQKWDSWRYLAMLGNTRTHIRNVFGNTMQYMVTEAKDNVGGAIEGVVDSTSKALGGQGIDRTKTILNRLSASDNELVKLARSDADKEAYRMLNDMGSKYNEAKGMVENSKEAFDSKFMNFINDVNSNALEGEDYFGLKNKYSKSLARFLKANGADSSIFNATDDASKSLLSRAREYATDQAKQATFHEYSLMADKLSNLSKEWMYGEKANVASKAGSIALESLVPFKKTPINVLKQGIKYSPISIAKALTSDIAKLSKGTINASDMIEDLAAGMTGTGILALGAFLTSQGYLNGKGNEDYNVKNADVKQGRQEYAIQVGDKSYTIDWLAPFSLPLFVGAELYNQLADGSGDDESVLDKVLTSISTIGEPITEMSMLQGINDSLEQLSYSKESALGTLGGNLLTGYITQGIPTAFGQISRSVDPTRRSTYSDQDNGFKKQVQRSLLKSLNKIPGASNLNEEYRNEWGETEENTGGSVLGRLAYNMMSPGYYADSSNATTIDDELQRLYQSTGESPFTGTSSGKVGDAKLSRKDYTEYQKMYGQNSKSLVESIVNNSDYNGLSDSDKVEVINKAYNISKAIADFEVGGKAVSDTNSKLYNIYKESGVNGVANSLISSRYEKIAKEQKEIDAINAGYVKENGKADTTAYKKAQEINEKYGEDADAYYNVTQTQIGTDKNGKPKYLSYDDKTSEVYKDKGEEGIKAYAAVKSNLPDKYNNGDLMDLMNRSTFSDEDKAYYFMKFKKGNMAKVPSLMDNPVDQYNWYYIKSLIEYSDGKQGLSKSDKSLIPSLTNYGVSSDYVQRALSEGWYN